MRPSGLVARIASKSANTERVSCSYSNSKTRSDTATHRHANGAPQLLLKGTNFQIKVWSALLRVPQGRLISYGELAREIGQPKAAQAVGRALSTNPLGFIVPCHRMIRATGALGDYHWGKARRRAILAWEAAEQDAA